MTKVEDKYKAIHTIRDVKTLWKLGQITEAEAKERCKEPIAEINAKMTKIAKEFGKRPKLLNFAEAMRIRNFYI